MWQYRLHACYDVEPIALFYEEFRSIGFSGCPSCPYVLANKFYMAFCMPQPIHLDARIGMKMRMRHGYVVVPSTSWSHHERPNKRASAAASWSVFPKPASLVGVHQSEGFSFPRSKGHTDSLKHLRRFKRQCRIMANNDASS